MRSRVCEGASSLGRSGFSGSSPARGRSWQSDQSAPGGGTMRVLGGALPGLEGGFN